MNSHVSLLDFPNFKEHNEITYHLREYCVKVINFCVAQVFILCFCFLADGEIIDTKFFERKSSFGEGQQVHYLLGQQFIETNAEIKIIKLRKW